jgi:hypothetical protein
MGRATVAFGSAIKAYSAKALLIAGPSTPCEFGEAATRRLLFLREQSEDQLTFS